MEASEVMDSAVEEVVEQAGQRSLSQKLNDLKGLDLDNAVVKVFVAKVSIRNKSKRFQDVCRLNVHTEHQGKFKTYVTDCIDGYDHVCDLGSVPTVQDNRFYYVERTATDLAELADIVSGRSVGVIQNTNQLNEYNSYIIQLVFGSPENSLFAFRYIKGAWSANKANGKFFGFEVVSNELVVKIISDHRFQITPSIDFIQFGEDIFISDLTQFETAMNFHERLAEKKQEAIGALCDSPAIARSSKDPLSKVVGNDKHLMRLLASVHEKGDNADPVWLGKLRRVAEEAGNWRVKFGSDGKILIEEDKDYIKEVLTLLQNKRVKTVVDNLMFDVDGELVAVQAPSRSSKHKAL